MINEPGWHIRCAALTALEIATSVDCDYSRHPVYARATQSAAQVVVKWTHIRPYPPTRFLSLWAASSDPQ